MIQVFQPSLGKDELEAVREVFESNWLGRGRRVAEFERQFAGHRGVAPESMIATTCASEGLFTAAEVLGWAPGDEVVVPSISFDDLIAGRPAERSEEHTSELQSRPHLVCRLLLGKKNRSTRQSCSAESSLLLN